MNFSSFEKLEENHDSLEEYLHFSCKFFELCPSDIVTADFIPQLLQLALTALRIPNQRTQRKAYVFIEKFIGVLRRSHPLSEVDAPTKAVVENLVAQFSPPLVSTILANLAGNLPEFVISLDSIPGSIVETLRLLKKVLPSTIYQDCLVQASQNLPPAAVPELQRLGSAINEEFPKILRDLEINCRQTTD